MVKCLKNKFDLVQVDRMIIDFDVDLLLLKILKKSELLFFY